MKRKHDKFEVAYSSNSWVATFVETDLNKKNNGVVNHTISLYA